MLVIGYLALMIWLPLIGYAIHRNETRKRQTVSFVLTIDASRMIEAFHQVEEAMQRVSATLAKSGSFLHDFGIAMDISEDD